MFLSPGSRQRPRELIESKSFGTIVYRPDGTPYFVLDRSGNALFGGATAQSSFGGALELNTSLNANLSARVINQNAGVSASASIGANASTANGFIIAQGTGVTATRYGVTLGDYTELLTNVGNGWLMGTGSLVKPILFGTNSLLRARIGGDGGVGVGTLNVDNSTSALLQVDSTTRGAALPRMTGTQRDAISSVLEGLLLYNSSTHTLNGHNGTAWQQFLFKAGITVDAQSFTSVGSGFTWTKPTGAVLVFTRIIGAGEGGAGGARNVSTVARGGGAGGNGGAIGERWHLALDLPSSVNVDVGGGGAGGFGASSNGTSGFNGNVPSIQSSFGINTVHSVLDRGFLTAPTGGSAVGGTPAGTPDATSPYCVTGNFGGVGTLTNGGSANSATIGMMGGGGGGAGNPANTTTARAGGQSSGPSSAVGVTGTSDSAGTNGGDYQGGSGGGSGAGVGSNGGVGGVGGGGGGGGAGTNNTAGNGGVGGRGQVDVWTICVN